MPYLEYERMYRNDLNKYCGIPNCLELVVPVARGCPIGCAFCDVPVMQGLRERRVSVRATLAYIKQALAKKPFDYVSFYAPTFTLRRSWVLELCDAIQPGPQFLWKCVTTLAHLDAELLEAMAAAGCVRVSVGLETLDAEAGAGLPLLKRDIEGAFEEVAVICRRVGIELNCFVILGLPGDTLRGSQNTIRRVLDAGARVRPTVYTPYGEMRTGITVDEIGRFNRQLFMPGTITAEQAQAYYRLLYANPEDRPTSLAEAVPAGAGGRGKFREALRFRTRDPQNSA